MDDGAEQPSVYGEGDLTYEDYLRVQRLLDLQDPQSEPPHHDEMLFIIIHQAYELWFKLALHEVDTARDHMREGNVLRARHFLERIVDVMELLTQQIHLLETMDPVDFLQFRDRLAPASGFQSVQFRELEFATGLQDEAYLEFFDETAKARLQDRLKRPSLRDEYYAMLARQDDRLPEEIDPDWLPEDDQLEQAVVAVLKDLYEDPDAQHGLYLLTEALVSLDEQLELWREHHVRVVERVIGHKRGTGGSSGVDYLKSTTGKRAFPHLWEIRTYLDGDQVDPHR